MRLIKTMKPVLLSVVLAASIIALLWWLWQRQPRPQNKPAETRSTQSQNANDQKQTNSSFNILPKDGSVLTDSKIKLSGKANPNEFVLIFSNSSQKVAKSSGSGDFQVDFELDPKLNIVTITTLKDNFDQDQSISSLYLKAKDDPSANSFYAGSVKNIFDKLVTLTTASGEKTFRQKTSTKLILPKDAKGKEDQDIRVGDFLIALGAVENEKDFNAVSVEIIRADKPQNKTQSATVQLLTAVKQNLFSAKYMKDGKIIEFSLDKNSKVLAGDKDGTTKDIAKDKKAIVFYQNQDDKNLTKTIYLLP